MAHKSSLLATAWLAIALLLLLRLLFVVCYLAGYTDSDQILFAAMGNDYSKGLFHVPMVYGQSYNFPFESWLSIPFLWLGIPWNFALPLTTTILGIFPFLVLSKTYLKSGQAKIAILMAALTCLLSPEWHYLTSIPRGFTGGIAMLFLGTFLYAKYNIAAVRIFASFLISIAIMVAPNSAVLLLMVPFIPNAEYQFSPKKVLLLFIGIVPAIVLYYWIQRFFTLHPYHILHPSPNLHWSLSNALSGMLKLPHHFHHISWLHPITGMVWPILFALFAGLFWKKNQRLKALASAVCILWIFVLAGFDKTQDGGIAQDLPLSRFWLPLPILGIAIIANYFSQNPLQFQTKYRLAAVVFLTLFSGYFWVAYFQNTTKRHAKAEVVELYNTDSKKQQADYIKKHREIAKCTLVVLADAGEFTYLNAVEDPSGIYYYPIYERKTWVKRKYETQLPENFLFVFKNLSYKPKISRSYTSSLLDSAFNIHIYKIERNRANTWNFKQEIGF